MSNLPETSSFDPVYELQRTDSVDAGVAGAGVSNTQAQNLANRTKWLYDQLAAIAAGTFTGTTQPIFDSSAFFATTEFAQENKGSYVTVVRVNATINPLEFAGLGWLAVANCLFVMDNLPNNGQSITLQSLAAIPDSTAVHFKNEDLQYSISLITNGSELFVSPSNLDSENTGQNTLTLAPGCDITIVRSNDNSILGTGTPYWHVIVHSGNLHQWKTPTLQPNIINNPGATPGRFRKNNNMVILSGALLKSGGSSVFGLKIFTLPSGFRPATIKYFLSAPENPVNPVIQISVATNGDVTATVIANAASISDIGLDGITIPLD